MYWRLQQAAGASLLNPLGITFQEFLNTDTSSNRQSFMLALDLATLVSPERTSGEAVSS